MLKSSKPVVVDTIESIYKMSPSVIITHYHGVTVSQLNSLRESLKDAEAGLKVVKNTLAKIAANRAGLDTVSHLFSGPTAIVYSKEPVGAAKLVVKFAESHENFKIVGGLIDSQVFSKHSILELSKLLSLNETRSQIIGLLQIHSSKIVNILQAPASGITRVVKAYSDKQ